MPLNFLNKTSQLLKESLCTIKEYKKLKEKAFENKSKTNDVLRLLGLFPRNSSLGICRSAYPIYPNNLKAMGTVPGIVISDNNTLVEVENNFCFFGSPTSELITRRVFDYEIEQDGHGDGYKYLRYRGRFFEPRVHWLLDIKTVSCEPTTFRPVPGKNSSRGNDISERPNWGVMVQDFANPKWPARDIRESFKNYLITDYLVITRIPNFLSSNALASGKVIISIAGAHGLGTMAVADLLKNEHLIKQVAKQLYEKKVYQYIDCGINFGMQMVFEVHVSYSSFLDFNPDLKLTKLVTPPLTWGFGNYYWDTAARIFNRYHNISHI